jgi:hypothetical protein
MPKVNLPSLTSKDIPPDVRTFCDRLRDYAARGQFASTDEFQTLLSEVTQKTTTLSTQVADLTKRLATLESLVGVKDAAHEEVVASRLAGRSLFRDMYRGTVVWPHRSEVGFVGRIRRDLYYINVEGDNTVLGVRNKLTQLWYAVFRGHDDGITGDSVFDLNGAIEVRAKDALVARLVREESDYKQPLLKVLLSMVGVK